MPLQILLLEAAWLRDELDSRRGDLPAPGQPLLLGAPPPAPSGELRDLPFAEVLGHFQGVPWATLEYLEWRTDATPNKVRVVVAWLVEQGAIRLLRDSTDGFERSPEEVLEGFDAAVREIFQEALSRGYSLNEVTVSVFVHPQAWGSLTPLILGLPQPILDKRGPSAKRHLLRSGGGTFRLVHTSGHLVLQIATLEAEGPKVKISPSTAWVVLWLGETGAYDELRHRIAEIESRVGPWCGLLTVASSGASSLAAGGRWSDLRDPPKDLERLLLELAHIEPVAGP